MDHHSGRLVHHQQCFVFVDDTDRDILTKDRPLFHDGDLDRYPLPFLGLVAGLFPPAVDQYVSQRDERRRLGSGKLSPLGNKEIEADIAVRLDGKLFDVAQRLTLRRCIRNGCG